jgi:hypothetical protein
VPQQRRHYWADDDDADIHTYHSRYISQYVAEASQIVLRDAHFIPKLFGYEYTK